MASSRSFQIALFRIAFAAVVVGIPGCVIWKYIQDTQFSKIVLFDGTGGNLKLVLDGRDVVPSEVIDFEGVRYSTYDPWSGAQHLVVRDNDTVVLESHASLDASPRGVYVVFCGGGQWLSSHRIEYGGSLPDFSHDVGPQTYETRTSVVDGRETSFRARVDDDAQMETLGLLVSEGVYTRTQVFQFRIDTLMPFDDIPESMRTRDGMASLEQLRMLDLEHVARAEQMRTDSE